MGSLMSITWSPDPESATKAMSPETVTPIAMPGREAINAALHPAAGEELFFVATGLGDGSHAFSATKEEHDAKFKAAVVEMVKHLNQRPDHVVFVASADERAKMRAVFNSLKDGGLINHWPTVKIDYGVPDGTIRIDEDRS